MIVRFFILLFVVVLVSSTKSPSIEDDLDWGKIVEDVDLRDFIPKVKLRRQTNSPAAQRQISMLIDLSNARMSWEQSRGITLHLDDREFIKSLANHPDFDVNTSLIYDRLSLLVCAIIYEEHELIKELLKRDDLDVNNMGGSIYRPIQLALSNRQIFNLIINESRGLDLLAINLSGHTVVQMALLDDDLESAETAMRELRFSWHQLNSKERKMVTQMERQIKTAKLQAHLAKIQSKRIKID